MNWLVYASLGPGLGVTQIWHVGPYGTQLEMNVAVPSLERWAGSAELKKLSKADAVRFLRTYDVFVREDRMKADNAVKAALALL